MSVFGSRVLEGRAAYITGGTSGICYGIAEAFVEHGARVAVQGRDADKAAAAALQLGSGTMPFAADVRDYQQTAECLAQAAAAWGGIDILVCGAAGNFPAFASGLSANGFKAVVDIDLLGTFNACRAAYPLLRKPGAAILAISANHAQHAYAAQAHVCAAKAGVEMLCKTLALEWGHEGVRVNVIEPGPVDETEGMRRLAPTAEIRKTIEKMVPLRRLGRIEEIADAALFLCSGAAGYITGAVLTVDGGSLLAGGGLLTGGK